MPKFKYQRKKGFVFKTKKTKIGGKIRNSIYGVKPIKSIGKMAIKSSAFKSVGGFLGGGF